MEYDLFEGISDTVMLAQTEHLKQVLIDFIDKNLNPNKDLLNVDQHPLGDLQNLEKQATIAQWTAAINEIDWSQFIIPDLKSSWDAISNQIMNQTEAQINQYFHQKQVKAYEKLQKIQQLIQRKLKSYQIFQAIESVGGIIQQATQELINKSLQIKLQYKLCPGVQPPEIKKVLTQKVRKQRKAFTEWNNFSKEEVIEIPVVRGCLSYPFLSRVGNIWKNVQLEVVWYTAPLEWEITSMSADLIDTNAVEAQITRTMVKKNKAIAEVELKYSWNPSEDIWARILLEGCMCRVRIQDIEVVDEVYRYAIESHDGSQYFIDFD